MPAARGLRPSKHSLETQFSHQIDFPATFSTALQVSARRAVTTSSEGVMELLFFCWASEFESGAEYERARKRQEKAEAANGAAAENIIIGYLPPTPTLARAFA
jgi:hypothetical protein